MADLINNLFFGGRQLIVIAAHYDCPQGISPGRCVVTIPAPPDQAQRILDELPATGDVTFDDGQRTITIPKCWRADVAFAAEGSPPTASILIEDRRCYWSLGWISGRYNVPAEYRETVPLINAPLVPQGNQNWTQMPIPPGEEPIRPETAKNAQELAILCLQAMGETTYSVDALDARAYPSVEWDVEVPAVALQGLAERYGCRIVYRIDDDSVRICKEGHGMPLPDGPMMLDSPSLKPKPLPKKLIVRSALVKYQQRFDLEAVGLDFDGSWRLLNDLSFAPKNSIGQIDWTEAGGPPSFANLPDAPNLPGDRTRRDAVQLAARAVYLAYRITRKNADGDGTLHVPPDGGQSEQANYIKQIYLLPHQAKATKDDLGRRSPAPAKCYGKHTPPIGFGLGNPIVAYAQTGFDTEVRVPFTIDAEHGIVMFGQYLIAYYNGKVHPASIVLETACHFARSDTFQFLRREFTRDVPGGESDLPHVVIHEELLSATWANYGGASDDEYAFLTFQDTGNNDAELQARADLYLAGELLKLVRDDARTRTYPGIQPIFPDGAICCVSWSIGGGSNRTPSTTASLNTEHSVYMGNYQSRRIREDANLHESTRQREERAREQRRQAGEQT